uniref:WAP four-disulfide core domain 8 n=1 Tax=Urocitellus parryii TaxID=9999 RepID=A0A8D2GNE8_UROPR
YLLIPRFPFLLLFTLLRSPYLICQTLSCPRERLFCDVMRPDLCKSDFNCPDYMKCCTFACGKKCMDPYEEPCMLPFKEGDCKMRLQRWYYDFKKQQCRTFIYHGCQGNANSFLRLDDCKKACIKKRPWKWVWAGLWGT